MASTTKTSFKQTRCQGLRFATRLSRVFAQNMLVIRQITPEELHIIHIFTYVTRSLICECTRLLLLPQHRLYFLYIQRRHKLGALCFSIDCAVLYQELSSLRCRQTAKHHCLVLEILSIPAALQDRNNIKA